MTLLCLFLYLNQSFPYKGTQNYCFFRKEANFHQNKIVNHKCAKLSICKVVKWTSQLRAGSLLFFTIDDFTALHLHPSHLYYLLLSISRISANKTSSLDGAGGVCGAASSLRFSEFIPFMTKKIQNAIIKNWIITFIKLP